MSTKYQAVINTPGYLPDDIDHVALFDSVNDAWQYLAGERAREYMDLGQAVVPIKGLDVLADQVSEGTIILDTPGYDGDHDLGVAYTVVPLTDDQVKQLDMDH